MDDYPKHIYIYIMINAQSPSPKVYRQAFWMGLLGGKTPKRLLAWSNDNLISALDLGKLCREKRESLTGKKKQPVSWLQFPIELAR